MTKIVDVDTVRKRLNLDAVQDIDDVLDSILESVTTDIEADIRTKLSYGEFTDKFFVNDSLLYAEAYRQTFLMLNRGFVHDVSAVWTASTLLKLDATTANSRTDLTAYTTVVGDGESGVMKVIDYNLTRKYVSITYTAGFEQNSAGILEGTPSWVQELAILYTTAKFDRTHPTIRFENENNSVVQNTENMAAQLIGKHLRYEPMAVKSLDF